MSDTDKTLDTPLRFPCVFRAMHWLLGLSLPVLAVTGLSIFATSSSGWSIFAGVLPSFLVEGRIHLLHLSTVLVFFPALLTMVIVLCWLRVRPHTANFLLLGAGLTSAITGLLLLNPGGPEMVCVVARAVHDLSGLVVLPLAFLWHAIRGLSVLRGKLPAAFHPWDQAKLAPLAVFAAVAVLTTCMVLGGLPVSPKSRELVAMRISSRISPPSAQSPITELPFDKAQPLTVELASGLGFTNGRTQLTLRALHDDKELFVLAEWDDASENRQYMPWKKTADGWKHQVTNPDDENVYYEDKFSLIFPTEPDWQFNRFGCASYCHLGGGRAYGYKGAERLVDVWHWKGTRTDPAGQVDDKYWSAVDFDAKDIGRHGDPKTVKESGYEKNASKDKTRPKYLPAELDFSLVKQGAIPREHAVPYTEEAAKNIEVDTIVPGMVVSAFVGDRGDITCVSKHENGRWRLYMRRKLDTGSQYDVKFVPGGEYPFGCAAFDRSSKRHAYDFGVYRLLLER